MGNGQKRILIVDDDVTLGNVLRKTITLSNSTYQVQLACNADEALAQISRHDFDLIVTDIKMEGLSGLQLLEALRRVAPDTRTIAMTAFDSADIEEQARTLGVYHYITKPFSVQEFRTLVDVALEAQEPPTPEKLSPAQSKAVNKTLSDLRANTGTHAAFFIEEDTANVLGVASDSNSLDLTSLAKALIEITHRMTAEVARVFGGSSGFQRSQYAGETFNLTTFRLAGEGLLIVVYDRRVKEGLISFYARQALETLAQILQAEGPSETLDNASAETTTCPSLPAAPEPMAEFEQENGSEPMTLEQALDMGLLSDDFFNALEEES
jgi:two-component system response regulator (stage 0 sporulation protein F)